MYEKQRMLNSNIRCIEIFLSGNFNLNNVLLNSNIRCIEIVENTNLSTINNS